MKDIKELALKVAKEMNWRMDEMTLETFATRLIAAYTEGEEPDESQNWKGMSGAVAWHLIDRHGEDWADIGNKMDSWLKANTAPPEPAPQQQKPQTTTGDSADPAQPAAACAAPSSEEVQRMIGWLRVELGHLVTCQQAADMIDSLFARVDELKQACDKFSEAEILAARVPDGCVVVPMRDVIFAAGYLQGATTAGTDAEACGARLQKLIAAGDVKP